MIEVMISSRVSDVVAFDDGAHSLAELRMDLKTKLESATILGERLFEVWISEEAPPSDATFDAWEHCIRRVRDADVLLVLCNGNSGWAREGGDIGICHAELDVGLSIAPAKVRLILLPFADMSTGASAERDMRFRDYVRTLSRFRGATVATYDDAIRRCQEALHDATVQLVRLGGREARHGRYHSGQALDWSRMDYGTRRLVMEESLVGAIAGRTGAVRSANSVHLSVDGRAVLFICHAIPGPNAVPAAREMVGRPFLKDYEYAKVLGDGCVGPIHVVACHGSVTESQARVLVGFPDAIVISAPFGILAIDPVQHVQLVLISQCRDDASIRIGLQRLFDWLQQSGAERDLSARADKRGRIVRAIAAER